MSGRRLIGKPVSQLNQWTSTDYLMFITTRSIVAAGLLLMQDPLIAPPRIQVQQQAGVAGLQLPFAPPTHGASAAAAAGAGAGQPAQTEQAAQAGFFSRMFGGKRDTQ